MKAKLEMLLEDLEFDARRYEKAIENYPQKIGNEYMMGKRDMAMQTAEAIRRILEGK